jgi:hypothetical protein
MQNRLLVVEMTEAEIKRPKVVIILFFVCAAIVYSAWLSAPRRREESLYFGFHGFVQL